MGNKIRFKRRNGTRKQGFTYVGEQVCKVNMKVNTKLDRNNDRKKKPEYSALVKVKTLTAKNVRRKQSKGHRLSGTHRFESSSIE